MQAWIACIADARPLDEIAALIEDAGLLVEAAERHDHELQTMLDQIDARLKLARMLGAAPFGHDVVTARELVTGAKDLLGQGVLGYAVVVARHR